MTDRELLEYAAKAAGVEVWFPRMADGDGGVLEPCHTSRNGQTEEWNPLDDDGDALRLAVRLGLHVFHTKHHVRSGQKTLDMPAEESKREDPYAATRLAIVRAAAEIGRSKP